MIGLAAIAGFILGVALYRYYARLRLKRALRRFLPELGERTIGPLFPALHHLLDQIRRRMDAWRDDRRRYEAALSQLIAALNTLPWPVLLIGRDGGVWFWNSAAERWFDVPPYEPESSPSVYYWMAVADAELQEQIRSALDAFAPQRWEWTRIEPGERYRWDVHFIPVRELSPPSMVVFCFDRSVQERLQKYKTDMVSLLVHELRTPITALNTVEDLLRDDRPEDRARCLDMMHRQIERLTAFVEKLEVLGRSERPQEEAPGDVDLVPLVRDVARDLGQVYSEKRIDLGLVLPERAVVQGWFDLLRVMVSNVLDNAFKFSPEGSRIELQVEPEDGVVRLQVRDSGPGIPESEQGRIFERFYRGRYSRQAGLPGSGLGLSLVKHIVHRHGGTVKVESSVGQGTHVIVELPIRSPAQKASSAPERSEPPSE